MAEEPDVIRGQIQETRSALTEKLETLEGQVRDTVQSAKETVEGTIENVKSSVQETVASVKRTFDLPYQVDRHPWAMLGGSLLTGFVLGNYVEGRRQREQLRPRPSLAPSRTVVSDRIPALTSEPSQPAGLLSWLRQTFDDEIEKVKGMAIGAAMGIVRDLAKESLPKLAPQIDEVMNSATLKLGGEPFAEPLVEPARPDPWP